MRADPERHAQLHWNQPPDMRDKPTLALPPIARAEQTEEQDADAIADEIGKLLASLSVMAVNHVMHTLKRRFGG